MSIFLAAIGPWVTFSLGLAIGRYWGKRERPKAKLVPGASCACGCGLFADGLYDSQGIPALADCEGLPFASLCRARGGFATRVRANRMHQASQDLRPARVPS